jgi:hypothetical protein
VGIGSNFFEGKEPEREADHSLPFNVLVKNICVFLTPLRRVVFFKFKDNLSF